MSWILTLGLSLWAPATVTQAEWTRAGTPWGPSVCWPRAEFLLLSPHSLCRGGVCHRAGHLGSDLILPLGVVQGSPWSRVGAGQGVWPVVVHLMAYTKPLDQG